MIFSLQFSSLLESKESSEKDVEEAIDASKQKDNLAERDDTSDRSTSCARLIDDRTAEFFWPENQQ